MERQDLIGWLFKIGGIFGRTMTEHGKLMKGLLGLFNDHSPPKKVHVYAIGWK